MVWNHHPLSAYAIVERVYIDGTVYYDRRAEEQRLTELLKEKSTAGGGGTGQRAPVDQRAAGSAQERQRRRSRGPPWTRTDRQGGHRATSEPRAGWRSGRRRAGRRSA